MKPAHVELKFKPGVWVEPAQLFKAIKSAGFTPTDDVRLTVSGTLREKEGQWSLELDDTKKPVTVPLLVADEKLRPSVQAQADQAVIVEGTWKALTGKVTDKEKMVERPPGSLEVRKVTAKVASKPPSGESSDEASATKDRTKKE